MKLPLIPALFVSVVLASACSDAGLSSIDGLDPALGGNPALGLQAFRAECASCHAAGDGFDLAFFAFPDTAIVRRALGHVDMAAALDIVAHVKSRRAAQSDRDANVFQPEQRVLSSDQAFAFELFDGQDRWPTSLSTAGLLAIDPRQVPIALALPKWSVEGGNTDWMPDKGIDADVASWIDGDAALEAYQSLPTEDNLLSVIWRLRVGSASMENPTAPCVFQDMARVDHERCFQNQRWIATFAGQHMLRRGDDYLHSLAHDAFWAVGFTARSAVIHGDGAFQNGVENWGAWMWLGWMFEPGTHASVYTGGGIMNLGLPRHATFLALRSQVARREGSFQPYHDVFHAARFAPDNWVGSAVAFGLRHLIERLEMGDLPESFPQDQDITHLREVVSNAYLIAVRKDASASEALRALTDRVLELMPVA